MDCTLWIIFSLCVIITISKSIPDLLSESKLYILSNEFTGVELTQTEKLNLRWLFFPQHHKVISAINRELYSLTFSVLEVWVLGIPYIERFPTPKL